ATLDAGVVRDHHANAEGRFGDGLAALESTVEVRHTLIENSARAGLLNAGAGVTFGDNAFHCNGFDLEGEAFGDSAFAFSHEGGNACGCPDVGSSCQVLTGSLAPPEPVAPPGDAPEWCMTSD